MPYRKPKRSYVLPVVTTLAVAAPLATLTLSDSTEVQTAVDSDLVAVPAQLAEVVLSQAPDIVLPLRELTGLDLPDLRLSDLRMLPLPTSIPIPQGLPLPPGVELPREIPLPNLNSMQNQGFPSPGQSVPGQQSTTPATPSQIPAPNYGAAPNQSTVPGPGGVTGQSTAPSQGTAPGLGAGTGQNAAPGPGQAPGPNATPGYSAAPGQLPTQPTAPAQPAVPGQSAAPGQAPVQAVVPGQPAAPGQAPAQATAPGQSPTPAQTSGQPTAPGQPVPVQAPAQPGGPGQSQPSPGQTQPAIPSAQYIADPSRLPEGAGPDTPALSPGAVPQELLNQVGAQVKELSRDKPFSVVALTARDLADTTAKIRARQADGNWGPWYDTESVDTRRSDRSAAPETTGTEPIYVGNTNAVQILVTRKPAAAHTPQTATAPEDPAIEPAPIRPAPRTDDPAQLGAAALKAVLIDPGRGAIDAALSDVAAALPGGGPNVINRAQWGADESIRCDGPTYDDQLGGVTVHHTAGRNDYTKAESAGIVRAIYTYHAKTLGWCDIGYNALVDKYGQIFEGRYGGLDRPVQGAHAGGFNENTAGVALMGNYESEQPSREAIDAIGRFVGWRTKKAGLDPRGSTTMWSEGTEFTPYAQGEAVNLPIVFAHRDVGNTSCPGDGAYAMMDRIREIAAGSPGSPGTAPKPSSPQPDYSKPGQPQTAPRDQDLATLAALTDKLLGLVEQNLIAKYWAQHGGATGSLGAPRSELLPAAQGQQYAKFANGYVYSSPTGQVFEVAGAILERFLQLGADAGVLGLPLSNAYPVPSGLRADFQNGSLILNQLTGIVTTVWNEYEHLPHN